MVIQRCPVRGDEVETPRGIVESLRGEQGGGEMFSGAQGMEPQKLVIFTSDVLFGGAGGLVEERAKVGKKVHFRM